MHVRRLNAQTGCRFARAANGRKPWHCDPPHTVAVSMKPSFFYDRLVNVMEELVKFTLLLCEHQDYLVDRYSERKESAQELSVRVNQHAI